MKQYSREFKNSVIEALKKEFGNASAVCEKMGIPRSTYEKWSRCDEVFKKQLEEVAAHKDDYVEGKLFENIKKLKEKSIIYYLSTKGRRMGYGPVNNTQVSIGGDSSSTGKPMIIFSSTADEGKAQQGEGDVEGDES